ncbi:MAG: PLP-dependent cysteine synthase family protein [bacterium]
MGTRVQKKDRQPFKTLLGRVGNTPLVEIPHPKSDSVRILAKCEWQNPSGSVKDRAAANMVKIALEKGDLENKILLDATSGNTGIAYAMFAAAAEQPVVLALPENASPERKKLLNNYGATIILTSAMEGTDGAQKKVSELLAEHPDRYYCPDQYNNDANWQAHYISTGPEIWQQSQQRVTHFVAGLGTTGTFIGSSRFLQTKGVSCVEVQPDTPLHALEGWKHLETAIMPGIYDKDVANERLYVSSEKACLYAKAAFRYLGLALSPSSAANLIAALDLADKIGSGTIVTIFADNALKYLNDSFWSDNDHLKQNPFC